MKQQLQAHLLTGFCDWTFQDYAKFIKAFKRRDLGDTNGIALDLGTKT
jgi:hypothetical protein